MELDKSKTQMAFDNLKQVICKKNIFFVEFMEKTTMKPKFFKLSFA